MRNYMLSRLLCGLDMLLVRWGNMECQSLYCTYILIVCMQGVIFSTKLGSPHRPQPASWLSGEAKAFHGWFRGAADEVGCPLLWSQIPEGGNTEEIDVTS